MSNLNLLIQTQHSQICGEVHLQINRLANTTTRPTAVFGRLHVGFDERGKDAVLLQEVLGRVVLQDVASLHDDDEVGREDGVDAVLQTHTGHHDGN